MKHSELSSGSNCQEEMKVKPGMFYWRGKYYSGLVCEKCNTLHDNPEDSFEKAVTETKE